MSDVEIIIYGSSLIVLVLGFVVWYFRAPKGVGNGKASVEENRTINSTTAHDNIDTANYPDSLP